ncbi:MAG: hypothetical protein M1839_003414 [Geoglossum umbratile]|nr:MAG: hypothetical protein M1839_003414 [Geoglossum umbratile]
MSFRKRNVGLSSSSRTPQLPSQSNASPLAPTPPPGTRPSPIDGRLTTSTGTPSLDALLAGHAGFALGTSILIEEGGTTDFGGALLRYYAAEGVVQGHRVHLVGVGELWGRELPGLVGVAEGEELEGGGKGKRSERMKIAWRYERLGEFGGVAGSRAPPPTPNRAPPAGSTPPATSAGGVFTPPPTAFCHTFDLTKRLVVPSRWPLSFLPTPHPGTNPDPQTSPFTSILHALTAHLVDSPPNTIHRLVIPTLLSPAMYPRHASQPQHLLRFLHGLRGLLRKYPAQLTAMITLPLELFPRDTGLVRWIELLSDGVVELTPFPHLMDSSSPATTTSGAATAQEDQPQGMVKIHRLPIFHEKGGGGGAASGLGEDLAFTVSRRKFAIKAFSLPPVEGDTDAQQGKVGGGEGGKQTTVDIEF